MLDFTLIEYEVTGFFLFFFVLLVSDCGSYLSFWLYPLLIRAFWCGWTETSKTCLFAEILDNLPFILFSMTKGGWLLLLLFVLHVGLVQLYRPVFTYKVAIQFFVVVVVLLINKHNLGCVSLGRVRSWLFMSFSFLRSSLSLRASSFLRSSSFLRLSSILRLSSFWGCLHFLVVHAASMQNLISLHDLEVA